MAASMWRMNGSWRRMAGVLLLCALLLSNEVFCQDDDAPAPDDDAAAPDADAPDVDAAAPDDAAASTVAAGASGAPDAAAGDDSGATAAPGDSAYPATIVPVVIDSDGQNADVSFVTDAAAVMEATAAPKVVLTPVVPDVKCVGEKDIQESNAVKAEVDTTDCEATKSIIEANAAAWCPNDKCNIEIFQDGKNLLVASNDAQFSTLAAALQSEALKDKLGVTKTETPSSSGSGVFVGILVTGLLAALAIVIGYFKCQRRPDAKGVRLAEEAHPADQENQGNTLVSVAPLNPPPETPEKPNVNGESTPDDAKTPPPAPTNGTSATKTADTEL